MAGAFASVALAGSVSAQTSDPLLNALIKKGVLTESEAKAVQTEVKDVGQAEGAPKFLLVNSAFKNVELFGDARFRYEYRETQTSPAKDTYARERFRYSLRFGLRGEAFDDFYYGLRLQTSANNRSGWATFGDEKLSSSGGGSTSSANVGPFGNGSDGINVGQAYAGWRATEWLDITLGRMPNPIYTTPMAWDPDLAPEGAAEKLKYSPTKNLELFGTFGQFLYQDTNPDNPAPAITGPGTTSNQSDAFLLAWQIGAKYKFNNDISAKIAPVLYNYTGHGQNSGFNGVFVGQGNTSGGNLNNATPGSATGFSANQTGINDLLVLEIPAEVNFKLGNYPARIFGDFALNLDGRRRAELAAAASTAAGIVPIGTAQKDDTKAYQIGFAIGNVDLVNGQHPKKGSWEFRTYWQHVEQYALDVNLIDSDFMEGRGNLEGVYAAVAYSLSANAITTVRYGYADRINKKLGTGGSNLDMPEANPATKYQLLQLDFTLKF